MTCIDCDHMVARYLDCELAGPDLAWFYKHLGTCVSCRSHLVAYRRLVILLGGEYRGA